jgi:hypothetical protein
MSYLPLKENLRGVGVVRSLVCRCHQLAQEFGGEGLEHRATKEAFSYLPIERTLRGMDVAPLWWCQLAQDFGGEAKTAVVFRVHHVLADGLALVTFMDAITEPADHNHTGDR